MSVHAIFCLGFGCFCVGSAFGVFCRTEWRNETSKRFYDNSLCVLSYICGFICMVFVTPTIALGCIYLISLILKHI